MVRVFLKGGVWKNSEDEILKAAVQKYGKQQWARVASLLNRKTAKQAKARWHEWLDPAIRKTEWSGQEEEKLLHLAKLMPSQWKTIAAAIGRTATQCQEHYEYVLDQAAAAAAVHAGSGGVGGSSSTDQLLARSSSTQLRTGQIDSHPESKPARPDPIDMDEDEMEMLQEARARLANTQGKKAKRKQRERILAEAKRLADLQKRRELKQAGLLSKVAMKKSKLSKRSIDYGVEIPFHKPAPVGFHDVSIENTLSERQRVERWQKIDFQKVNEQQYNTRNREAAAIRKKEESRMRILQQSNDMYAKAAKNANNEDDQVPARSFARGPLQLPEPTITDTELMQIAKMQHQQQQASTTNSGLLLLEGGGSSVTQALLGDYTDRPLPTPMRTPASITAGGSRSRHQSLMREATQLRKLERGTTPLLVQQQTAGQQQEEEDGYEHDDNDDDDDMNRKPAAKLSSSSTHQSIASIVNRKPPPRDQLGLNNNNNSMYLNNEDDNSTFITAGTTTRPVGDHDAVSIGASTFASKYTIRELARQQRRAAKKARQELEAALAALPAPQFEYELAVPADAMDVDDEDNKTSSSTPSLVSADRADIEAAEEERIRQEAEKLYEARNSVIKRPDLPRPRKMLLPNNDSTSLSTAQRMIQQEMLLLIQHDAHAFPLMGVTNNDNPIGKKKKDKKGKKRKQSTDSSENDERQQQDVTSMGVVALELFQERELDEAKQLIQKEMEILLDEKVALVINGGNASNRQDALLFLSNENSRMSRLDINEYLYTKSDGWVEASSDKTKQDALILASFKDEFETLQEATAALKKKNDKVEARLNVMTTGYTKRADKLVTDMQQSFYNIQESQMQLTVYQQLYEQEQVGGKQRIRTLQNDISKLKSRHLEKQKLYGELAVERRRQLKTMATTNNTDAASAQKSIATT